MMMKPEQTSRFESIRKELEDVQRRFLCLLDEIPDRDWERRLAGEGWTVKQEMVHIVQVVNVIRRGIEQASTGHSRSAMGMVPAGLRSWVNGAIIVPMMARGATRQSIAEGYHQAHDALLALLKELPEEAWSRGMPYPSQFRTVEQLAHRPAEHFEEHVARLRNAAGIKPEGK
ncbi:MAG: DinB family protein [Chloroflexota bacterium]|nr:MAG: DinB family protein [Chloroflexota bacterium]